MKKLFTVLAGSLLMASFANAATISCPTTDLIRSQGSNFTYAHMVDGNSGWDWTVIATPFNFDGKSWQTSFTMSMPSIMDSDVALNKAKYEFKYAPILLSPSSSSFGEKTVCVYTPKDFGMTVVVSTPAEWGFTKS